MGRIAHWVFALVVLIGCSSKAERELILAASEGDLTQVRALLERGADVNHRLPDNGTTALIAAARNGHKVVVNTLLAAGANINAVDHDVGTALYWAAFNGQVDVMKSLLSQGANLSCNAAAAAYLLKIIRDRNYQEVEALTIAKLRQEGLDV